MPLALLAVPCLLVQRQVGSRVDDGALALLAVSWLAHGIAAAGGGRRCISIIGHPSLADVMTSWQHGG